MPALFQWLFCFCLIDSGQDVFYTGILCNRVSVIGGKIKGFFQPQHPWCWCVSLVRRVWQLVGHCSGVCLMCVPELGRPLLGWHVSTPDPLLVWSCGKNVWAGDGKMGWVPWGSTGALKVCLAKAERACLLSTHPISRGIWISLMPRFVLICLLMPCAYLSP